MYQFFCFALFSDDFTLPKSLQCGGFQNVLTLSVIWFSSGGTKSVLHNDDVDNINCILDGGKSLVMIDKVFIYFNVIQQVVRP